MTIIVWRKTISIFLLISSLFLYGHMSFSWGESPQEFAKKVYDETNIQGGLVVHLGCDDGKRTAALRVNDRYVVQGLDTNKQKISSARDFFHSKNLNGFVTAEKIDGSRLPYVDNTVNLVVGEKIANLSMDEIMRVLAPNGIAYLREEDEWIKNVKPRPETIDEWTHFLHDATNNAVSQDKQIHSPNHIQWIGEPKLARSHDHLASMSAAVSAGGRVFYIADEGPMEALIFPAEWYLIARDAFNGVQLWKRPIGPWEGHLRGFRSGPPELSRRLVAIEDRVYVTLGYGEPVTVLDAATGEILHTYEETKDALEIVYRDGVLFVVTGKMDISEVMKRRGASPPPRQKRLFAIDTKTKDVLWKVSNQDTAELMPLTLAIGEEKAYFQNPDEILSLNLEDGSVAWRTSRPIRKHRRGWSTPTLVVYDDVVISADREAPKAQEENHTVSVQWNPTSQGGNAPPGEMIAYSAETGNELWRAPCQETYNAPPDVLIIDNKVWSGELVQKNQPGITRALDVHTGEVQKQRPEDQECFSVGFGHHRCYRNKATLDYLLLGRSGVEFIDVDSGDAIANHWIRGTCQYGIMPSNGLIYVPPHSCACFIEAKLNGFIAVSSKPTYVPEEEPNRLEKGPAYDTISLQKPAEESQTEWPTYRRDPQRSGRTKYAMPTESKLSWKQKLGSDLTSPVASNGMVFVADTPSHRLYALNSDTGEQEWCYTAGGRIDSPPTIYQGLALFGSADGYVYCLRVSDGELIWRFQAAPRDQRHMVFGQLESVWPVPGNVLVLEEDDQTVAYAAAGRSSYVDGGMYFYKLDVLSGKMLARTRIDHRDPETELPPPFDAQGVNIPGSLPDVLSSNGESVFMRHMRFDRDGKILEPNVPHLFSPTGFLDDSWWHRTYWIYGTDMQSGWGGWPKAGNTNPSGRLLVLDDEKIYGYGRLGQYATHGSHVALQNEYIPWPPERNQPRARGATHYRLFSTSKNPDMIEVPNEFQPEDDPDRGKTRNQIDCYWSRTLDVVVRAMVLAEDTLFVAGPPELLTPAIGAMTEETIEEAMKAYETRKGARLCALSTRTGEKIQEVALDSSPVLDGMIAAQGRWYLSTESGEVICLGRE